MAKKKTKKKAKKKPAKKKVSRKRIEEVYWLSDQRKRLGLKRFQITQGLEKTEAMLLDRDQKLLEDKREDLVRRKSIFLRAKDFEHMLKAQYGRRISVRFSLDEESDDLRMIVEFRPKKHEHPFDADEVIGEAFEISGLHKCMKHYGSGTTLFGKVERDNDFGETKPRL